MNQEKGVFRRRFLEKCTPLLAVAHLGVRIVVLGPIFWLLFVSLGVTLDSAETPPLLKPPLFLVPELCNEPKDIPPELGGS